MAIDGLSHKASRRLGLDIDVLGWWETKASSPERRLLCAIGCYENDTRRGPHSTDILSFHTDPYKWWEIPSEHYYMGPYSNAEYRVDFWLPLPQPPEKENKSEES